MVLWSRTWRYLVPNYGFCSGAELGADCSRSRTKEEAEEGRRIRRIRAGERLELEELEQELYAMLSICKAL